MGCPKISRIVQRWWNVKADCSVCLSLWNTMVNSCSTFSCSKNKVIKFYCYSTAVQHFSFVLTSLDSKWTFGFCRQAPNAQTALVLMSYLPWHEFFYKILNQIAELMQEQAITDLNSFLEGLYQRDVPSPSTTLHIPYGRAHRVYTCKSPNTYTLPSIPENVGLFFIIMNQLL